MVELNKINEKMNESLRTSLEAAVTDGSCDTSASYKWRRVIDERKEMLKHAPFPVEQNPPNSTYLGVTHVQCTITEYWFKSGRKIKTAEIVCNEPKHLMYLYLQFLLTTSAVGNNNHLCIYKNHNRSLQLACILVQATILVQVQRFSLFYARRDIHWGFVQARWPRG